MDKTKKFIYLFVFSLSLVTGGALILTKGMNLLSSGLITIFVIFFLAVGIYALAKLDWDFAPETSYQKSILYLFFFYSIVVVARGIPTDYNTVKEFLLFDYLCWPFFIPLFIYFDKRLMTLAYLMNAIYFLGVFFLLMCIVKPSLILDRVTAENFIHPFAFGCGFLLLNARYLSKTKKIVAFFALAVGIFSFIYLARRNGIISYSCLILCALALNAKYLSASNIVKIFPVFAAVMIVALLSTDSLPASFTERLTNRLTEDSRSNIFDYYFADMEDHKVFGKGMRGTFYYPQGGGTDEYGEAREVSLYRNGIENGYLQLYLNGGFIYVILFGLVLLPAALLGIFRSSNQLVQAAGIIVFLWLLDMAIYGLPRLTLEYILVWICAGICYKKSLR